MLLSLVCAFAATLAYGMAAVLQAAAARGIAAVSLDARTLTRLAFSPLYLVGLVLDVCGFLVSIVALRDLPLFFVQSAVAAAIGVTAVGAVLFLHTHITPREVTALVVMLAGLVMLAISSSPSEVPHVGTWTRIALMLGPGVAIGAILFAVRLRPRAGAVGTAVCAGLSFAGAGVSGRVLHTDSMRSLATDPGVLVLLGYAITGTATFAAALARTSVTRVAAICSALETVVPAVVGITVLEDRARSGLLWLAVLGFVLTIAAAVAVARLTPDA